MKRTLILVSCFFLWGCPVYDPQTGAIKIKNYSASAVYVYSTCSKKLPCVPQLMLLQSLGDSAFDSEGNKINDTLFYPNYRINAHSHGSIGVWGSPKQPMLFCNDKKIRLYFITEEIMRTKNWKEICQSQIYQRMMILTQSQLDVLNWQITYK